MPWFNPSGGNTPTGLQAQSTTIPLWNFNSKKLELLDTGMKDMTFMKWSKTGPQLAIGTAKGNLLIYHRKARPGRTLPKSLSHRVSRVTVALFWTHPIHVRICFPFAGLSFARRISPTTIAPLLDLPPPPQGPLSGSHSFRCQVPNTKCSTSHLTPNPFRAPACHRR